MLASSGVTRNTVIMYPTQEWSLYHRMGRVYYQNIWLQKKANCLRAIWNVQKHQYTLKGGIARVPMYVVKRLVLLDKVDPCCRMGHWGSCNIVTFLSLNSSREQTRVSWKTGKCWWIYSPWEDPDLSSAVKAQVSAIALVVRFLSAIF